MNRVIRLILVIVAVSALAIPVAAQQADHQTASNPLVQLLQSKGILTAEEAATIRTASTTGEANERLAHLLLSKGLISQDEYNTTVAASAVSASASANTTSGAHLMNAASSPSPAPAAAAEPVSPAPAKAVKMAEWPTSDMMAGYDNTDGATADASTIPAVAPVRVLPITLPKDPKGIIPDIKLGSGIIINPYGFFKATAISDTSNSGGTTFGNNDFPLPLLLGDTGPNSGNQFRIAARTARFGSNFYWPISGPNLILTGKLEFDWAGDYTVVNSTNISSTRTTQAQLRLAFMRMDYKFSDGTNWFAEFGQDWTLLASSTQYDVIQYTAGVAQGNPYERVPQFKTGLQFTTGKLKIAPEFAITLGAFGDSGLNTSVTNALLGSAGVIPTGFQNQSRFGAILGPDSGQPGVQGRIVFDFPLNSDWKGVPNAELIVSGGHEQAQEIVLAGNIPATLIPASVNLACPNGGAAGTCSLRSFYPTGYTVTLPQNMFTVEAQIPTPWFTIVAKLYKGDDMRFMFAGQLNSAFADAEGGTAITIPPSELICVPGMPGCTGAVVGGGATTATCTAGTATVGACYASIGQNAYSNSGDPITFATHATATTAAPAYIEPYRPIRGYGGLTQLGIPLSRVFHANPDGRNAGWRLFIGYGVDAAYARDVIRSGGNHLQRTDIVPISLRYKINRWAELVHETSWYDTRTADSTRVLFRGVDAHVNHDWRNEFGTIFTF
ncbi:MAG TPA: hypothetical protein VJX29_03355 [Candidatus Acidoferrales bacterium]|nr:hypothetical protein [Candidatus Acidoferrales bacterium]